VIDQTTGEKRAEEEAQAVRWQTGRREQVPLAGWTPEKVRQEQEQQQQQRVRQLRSVEPVHLQLMFINVSRTAL
jgi:hypothetical protein